MHLGVLVLSACGNDSSNNQTTAPSATTPPPSATAPAETANATDVAPQKTYHVAVEREFTPLIVPGENGKVTGFEADVLEAIGKEQGFQADFLPMPWSEVFAKLDASSVDIAGSGIIMTEERLQKWDFSEPFIVAKYAVVVPQDSTITKSEDLQGKRVAVQPDSAFAEFAQSKTQNIVSTETIWMSIKSVITKDAEAAMVNTVIAEHFVAKHPEANLKVVAFVNDKDIPLGYALKKGNVEIQKQINEGLEKIKANGEYDKIKAKWNIK